MRLVVVVLRLLAACAITVTIVAQFVNTATNSALNPFNFFGYFTMQSNMLVAVGFYLSAIMLVARKVQPRWLLYLRASTTVYMVIVGIVYNTLLSDNGQAVDFTLPWFSPVLHVIMPIYVVLDWILFGDRRPLRFSRVWVVLIFPIIWIVVILIRGATDGWVPYPFLDPAGGYGSVAVYVGAILILSIVLAFGAFALSRVRILKI